MSLPALSAGEFPLPVHCVFPEILCAYTLVPLGTSVRMGHVLFSEHCSQILRFLSPVPCGLLCVLGALLHSWLRPQMLRVTVFKDRRVRSPEI